MRTDAEYEEAMRWLAWGLNDCQIERVSGISRRTVLDWRHGRGRASSPARANVCPRCSSEHELVSARYSYLLGLYLGDGWISPGPRGVYRLRIVQDQRYPFLIAECARAIADVLEGVEMGVGFVQKPGCIEIYSYWKHWPCLFPQTDAGRKMDRRIRLASWQEDVVRRHPEELLRGLIHSDGCRFTNVVGKNLRPGGYSYSTYAFTNASGDIRKIFCMACDQLDIRYRRSGRNITISRRADVEKLESFIGPKA
jgi:hypothetical protein